MASGFRTDFDRNEYILAYAKFFFLLVLSLLTSIIACIWVLAIIAKKIGIRRRQTNLIKFGPGNNPYYDVSDIIEELRIQSKILNFSLLIVFLEAFLVIVRGLDYYARQSCLVGYFQTNSTWSYMKHELASPIVACRIYAFSSVIEKILILVDIAIFGIGLCYIKSLIERAKSPLNSKWKHIAILTCSIVSLAFIFANPYTIFFFNTIYVILLQVFLISAMVAARTLYRHLTKQQRDLVHFNRPDRYKIIESIERLKKRYKLIVVIIFISSQVGTIVFNVYAISKLIQEIFVDNCQFEYCFHIHLYFNTTAHTKIIINNIVNYSKLFNNVSLSLGVINIILLNIIYGVQALIHYFYKSRKRVYRYNMHNLFNPELGQPLFQDYVRAHRTCTD